MMQTIRKNGINQGTSVLLQDCKSIRPPQISPTDPVSWIRKFKGAMTKQPKEAIDAQLYSLRNEWW